MIYRSDLSPRGARRAGVAAMACFALAIAPTTANAGFFDFLFPQAASQPAPYYPEAAPRSYHKPKPRSVALHRKVQVAKINHSAPRVGLDFMDDDSLHNGDAVMTENGIRIFTGSSSSHHNADDFAKLSEIKGISSRERAALVAIDAHLSASGEPIDHATDVVVGRSAADAGLSEGSLTTDAQGRQIRYVGP